MSQVKKELLRGVFYTALAKYAGIVVHLIVTAVLARLLTPDDFGVVAIAVVIINFFSMLSDMGIGPAIIQKRDLSQKDLSHIFALTMYIGLFLSIAFFAASGAFAEWYKNASLKSVIQLFSLSIFFHCIDIVPSNLLKRDKKFKFIAHCNVLVQIVCGVVSVIAAFLNFGIYSLLIQPVLGSALLFLIDYIYRYVPFTFAVRLQSIKKIVSYSSYQFLFSFVNYFSRNLDKLVVGKTFSIAELGYYEKSYRLMMLPVGNLSHVITPAIQPIFSEFQNDKDWLFSKSLNLFKVLILIGFPLTAFLFFASEELVLTVFGAQWQGAVPVFKILSLSVGIQIIYSPQGAFFQSANAVKEMFFCGLVTAALNIAAVFWGCMFFQSLTGLAWCINFAYVCAFVIVYYVMIKVVFEKKIRSFLKIMIQPTILAFVIAFFLFATEQVIYGLNVVFSLCVKGCVFALIMLLYEMKYKTFRSYLLEKKK